VIGAVGVGVLTLWEREFITVVTLLEGLVEQTVESVGVNALVVGLDVFLECRTTTGLLLA
jgi:hypothetical protein